ALDANTFTRTGYKFAGWATTTTGDIAYDDTQKVLNLAASGNVDLYAKWTPIEYTVVYNANGGTGTVADQTIAYDTSASAKENGFTFTGHTFIGWTLTTDGTGKVYKTGETLLNLATTETKVNFYAQWTANAYNVVFEPNAPKYEGTMGKQPLTYGVATTLNTNIYSRTGYDFAGWAEEATSGAKVKYVENARVLNLVTEGEKVLYAVWTPHVYKIAFDGNKATSGSMDRIDATYDVYATLPENAFSRTGYVFAGWAKSADGAVEFADGDDKVLNLKDKTGEVATLYAKWTANSYKINFNANTGSGEMTAQDMTYDVEKTLKKNEFTKEGYDFIGWALSADGEVVYADLANVKNLASEVDGSVTLYAKWRARSYEIKFDGNTATGGSMDNLSMDFDTPKELPENRFVKTGYHFLGWSKIKNADLDFKDGDTVVENLTTVNGATVTLYANWEANGYKVVFNANGGTGTMDDQSMVYDTAEDLDANKFSKTGYEFIGWSRTADGGVDYTDKQEVKNITPDSKITLYAVWEAKTYKVSFNKNGGADGAAGMADMTLTVDSETELTANAFKKTGYHFIGWARDADGEVEFNDAQTVKNITMGENVTLYAKWEKNAYTIRFSANTGTGDMDDIPMAYDESKSLTQCSFTKTGYTFAGWALTPTGSVELNDKATVKNLAETGTVMLYAKWTPNTYIVHFDANRGKGTMGNQTFTYDEAQKLNDNGFERDGYDFMQWNTDKDGKGIGYGDGLEVINLAAKGEVTLYAIWGKAKVSVTYKGEGIAYGTPLFADGDTDLTATVFADDGRHMLEDVTVKVGGKTLDKTAYEYVISDNMKIATLTVSAEYVTGNVVITAKAVEHSYTDSYEGYDNMDYHIAYCVCGEYILEKCTEGTAATCTECAMCEHCETTFGKPLGHDLTAWKGNGDSTHTRTCKRDGCEYSETAYCYDSKPIHHNATCLDDCYSECTCDICGGYYIVVEENTALGHIWSPWTEDGKGGHSRYCYRDNKHTEKGICHDSKPTVVAPTCLEDGYTVYVCDTCSYTWTIVDEGSATGHAWGAWIYDGKGGHYRICENDESHVETGTCVCTNAVYTPATCTDDAYTTYKCDTCDHVWTVIHYGTSFGHKWSSWKSDGEGRHFRVCSVDSTHIEYRACLDEIPEYVPATCTENAYNLYECPDCAYTWHEEIANSALGHDFVRDSKRDVKVTCTVNGVEAYTCSRCTARNDKVIYAKGHAKDYGLVNASKALCLYDGYTGDKVCTVCGDVLEYGTKIPMTGHHYVLTEEKAVTCTTDGYKEYTCVDCLRTKQESIVPALGHNMKTSTGTSGDSSYTVHYCTRGDVRYTDVSVTVKDSYTNPIANEEFDLKTGYTTKSVTTDANGRLSMKLEPGKEYELAGKFVSDVYKLTVDANGVVTYSRVNPVVNCKCLCHNTGFLGKLTRWFYSLLNRMFGNKFRCCNDMVPYK
ncbi:MAG: InlB B-repeat-containing protein, partial [Clostridia bacterium]|nr:InlB B-repeat-containing protein [Clostridia bacterium]